MAKARRCWNRLGEVLDSSKESYAKTEFDIKVGQERKWKYALHNPGREAGMPLKPLTFWATNGQTLR